MTDKEIKERLLIELPRYSLSYEEVSDPVPAFKIVKPGKSRLLGLIETEKTEEIARITFFGSKTKRLEVMIFDKSQIGNIREVFDAIKEETGREYKLRKGYN